MKIKKVLTVLLILGVLVMGGGYFAYRGYKSARQVRLIQQARRYLAKSDERRALLSLQSRPSLQPQETLPRAA